MEDNNKMVTTTGANTQKQGDGITSPVIFQNNFQEMSEQTVRSQRFGSLRRRKRVEYFEDTSEGSDGRTSSDEYETTTSNTKNINDGDDNNNNENIYRNNNQQKNRKNSHFAFSNVKKKITSTFQRRHSVTMHPPSPPTQTKNKPFPMRRSSTATSSYFSRKHSIDESHAAAAGPRKTSLRRHVTMAAVRLHEQSKMGSGSNPALDRLYQKSQFQLESSSSTPDIQTHIRNKNKLKTFNIHILGSKTVGKTALTVRFLTGRYIHEYKSATEESYSRVMKYDDENVDVKIHINDVENMERDIELDGNSGIMILYSIVDRTSYTHAKMILQYLAQNSITGYYPVMLIGTKRDLSRMRQVDRKESFQTATQHSCTQFDVSSASNRRVVDSFHALFRQIEIRHLLQGEGSDNDVPTYLNPPIVNRSGTVRYGTA